MLAIIPARGGSKGLPGKNIKKLNGVPLIAYTIKAALSVHTIDRVFVSTDDPEIAKIAIHYGAECPWLRPDHLATDDAKSIDVYVDVLHKFLNEGIDYEEVIILQPTSPLRKAEHIVEAIQLFRSESADSVISYCEEQHPIVWHKYLTENRKFLDIFKSHISNRQDERKSYYPNGAIYIFKSGILKKGTYYTDNSYAYVMPRNVSVDIDEIADFEYCEYIMRKKSKEVE